MIFDDIKNRIVFFDGGMGSLLQQQGLEGGLAPENWLFERPDVIKKIHLDYLNAGADIIKTCTFGANELKLEVKDKTMAECVKVAVSLCKEAVKEANHGYVALDIGPTGRLMEPMGDLEFEEAVRVFGQMAQVGKEAGADLVLVETLSDSLEAKAAVLGVKEYTDLPVIVTMTFDDKAKLLTGGDIPSVTVMLDGLKVDALGMNCSLGPHELLEFVKVMRKYTDLPLVVNPNAGLPSMVDGKTVYNIDPEEFSEACKAIVECGVSIIGGCCGTTPAHIKALSNLLKDTKPIPISPVNRTIISSYTHAVDFADRPVIIGERINPTGKKRFKEALKEHDINYILKEAVAQEQNGADVLDVNVGLPEIDEASMMQEAVHAIQGITGLPLQIDTTKEDAMEKAMRIYNGKPLVNSVNGKESEIQKVFPLVKKYGGVVVALTIDEDGIPATAEKRVQVAEYIIKRAADYGIKKCDIIVDPLAMTISAEQDSALVTLDAIEQIREKLGVFTSLGVSNISFGLPQRANINTTFFTMALQKGLTAAIMNPASESMMAAHASFCALTCNDKNCMNYISKYANVEVEAPKTSNSGQISLQESVIKGLKEDAQTATKALIETVLPLDIINSELVPALDIVGQKFEKGTLFLPQLLMSAEAAKMAFEVIKMKLIAQGNEAVKKDKIVLATVKGDIHDIGKNIVKVLLENYSYDVIDLGRDVDPDLIVNTAIEQKVKLVGLSALMTTTVVNMKITIEKLREKYPECKIMVGGAVMTQEYADEIGADFYSKDAMGSVRYAEKLLG